MIFAEIDRLVPEDIEVHGGEIERQRDLPASAVTILACLVFLVGTSGELVV